MQLLLSMKGIDYENGIFQCKKYNHNIRVSPFNANIYY